MSSEIFIAGKKCTDFFIGVCVSFKIWQWLDVWGHLLTIFWIFQNNLGLNIKLISFEENLYWYLQKPLNGNVFCFPIIFQMLLNQICKLFLVIFHQNIKHDKNFELNFVFNKCRNAVLFIITKMTMTIMRSLLGVSNLKQIN